MSVYKEIKTEFKNEQSLLAALADLNLPVERAQTNSISLYGYHGDIRPEKAAVVIRREYVGSVSNDLGFAWDEQSKTYNAIISEYDLGAGGQRIVNNLKQKYAFHEVTRQAKAKGYTVHTVEENGTLRVTLRRR